MNILLFATTQYEREGLLRLNEPKCYLPQLEFFVMNICVLLIFVSYTLLLQVLHVRHTME